MTCRGQAQHSQGQMQPEGGAGPALGWGHGRAGTRTWYTPAWRTCAPGCAGRWRSPAPSAGCPPRRRPGRGRSSARTGSAPHLQPTASAAEQSSGRSWREAWAAGLWDAPCRGGTHAGQTACPSRSTPRTGDRGRRRGFHAVGEREGWRRRRSRGAGGHRAAGGPGSREQGRLPPVADASSCPRDALMQAAGYL